MPDYSGIRGDAPRGRYGQPLGFPGGPHWSDPDVPRFPMKGDRMATIPETREFHEEIIRQKDREAEGDFVANDPRAHYGTKEMKLDDIRRRIESGRDITDEEGVEFLQRFNGEEDLKMLLEYLNRAIKKAPPAGKDSRKDIMGRSA